MRQTTLTQSRAPGGVLAGPISHTSTQYIDFVEIFNISLDLSIYFAHLSGCSASFMYGCHSILESYNLFLESS